MQIEFISSLDLREGRWQTEGVLVAMPFTEPAQARRSAQLMARRAGVDGLLLCIFDEGLAPARKGRAAKAASPDEDMASAGRAGFVSLVNGVYRQSRSEWFCYVAQDAFPGRDWLALALAGLQSKRGVLAPFNDGKWAGQLAAFGLARREWADQLYDGDFFFPGYRRHYADVELTVLALQQQGLVYSPQSVLIEVDWEKDGKAVDAADRALYAQRASAGFDGRVSDPTLRQRFR